MHTGAILIAQERDRQITDEGYTSGHDDGHSGSELAWAAACYAAPGQVFEMKRYAGKVSFIDPWPWAPHFDKRPYNGNVMREPRPDERVRCLVKAGALIAAEIDRLMRAGATVGA